MMTSPSKVVVVGGGRMGSGIAHAFLVAGCRVQIRDIDEAAVRRALEGVDRSLERAQERDSLAEPVGAARERLGGSAGLAGLGHADLVIEAVPEIPSLKQSVLETISSTVTEDAIVATNTSSISVSELARAVSRSERFVGMHFFNPVPVSKLVEIVRGDQTSDTTIARVAEWVSTIGKESITVRDAPGFATSRLGVAIGLEAIRMLEAGVASATDIDKGMTLGYGFPVGPLRLSDIVGLDVRLEIAEYLESQLGDRFTPPALLRRMVAEGNFGRKSGRGFYDWSAAS